MNTALENGIETLKDQIDARVVSYLSSCVQCGICAEACHFYTSTKDPRYTPINKVEPLRKVWVQTHTFWGKLATSLGLRKPMSEGDLANWEELAYDGCTVCSRCSMVCPMGIDIAYMIRKVKEGLAAAGFVPKELQEAGKRALEFGSPMGLTAKSLHSAVTEQENEYGYKIPVDVEGADYLCLLSSNEVVSYPEFIGSLAKIFSQAKVSWTLSSEYFEATNSGVQMGNSKIAAELSGRVLAVAEKLKVKSVISPECGHAYTTIRWDAPNFLQRKLPFSVVHVTELLDQLREQGRIKIKQRFSDRVTYHDPCNISRRGGVINQPRNLISMIAADFKEMDDHGNMNWCCGGGGGVSANERADGLRQKAFNIKARQIRKTHADNIITSCSVCRMTLEEGLENKEMTQNVLGITEFIAMHME
ncbi:MAG: (Fe-S)-binding protein [Gammaproteobacteria bacterium]|nr:(Fe-S)-binding protein [Gammaproteobacteria bacterium]